MTSTEYPLTTPAEWPRVGPITGVQLTSRGQKTPVFPGLFVESTRYRPGPFASKSARIAPIIPFMGWIHHPDAP